MGLLEGFGDDLPFWHIKILALVRVDLLRPDVREHRERLLPDPPGVFELDPEGGKLVRVAGAADTYVDTAAAQDIQGGRLGRHVQGMVHWQQDDTEAQTHRR